MTEPKPALGSAVPASFIFNPNWWYRNYGISFDSSFYLDRRRRIENDQAMRRALHERFGLNEADPSPRPVIGSEHVAGGFVVPALLGVEIRFACDQAPWPVCANLTRSDCLALRPPIIEDAWPMCDLLRDMDSLEREFGYVTGDIDTDGLLNTALHLRGQSLFCDLVEDRELVDHLFGAIFETQARVAECVQSRTGSSSIAVNRSILWTNRRTYLHSNCSVSMISPQLYASALLPLELRLAERMTPYGIHHCGGNLHLFAPHYAQTGAVFYDVGWGSDVARCADLLRGAFLNLRLSPVRMLEQPVEEIRRDTKGMLAATGGRGQAGVCCINMDYGTPDANVLAVIDVARQYDISRRRIETSAAGHHGGQAE